MCSQGLTQLPPKLKLRVDAHGKSIMKRQNSQRGVLAAAPVRFAAARELVLELG
jgi:hypothetical protein